MTSLHLSPDAELAHLNDKTRALLAKSDEERIYAIRQGTWLQYQEAQKILAKMEDLLNYPRITRMPNMLLVAPSFNGKTSLLNRFVSQHPPHNDPTGEFTLCPVVSIEGPNKPDVVDLYNRILEALLTPFKFSASVYEKHAQIKLLFQQMDVRVLIVDEIQHAITGSVTRQQEYRNALKSLGNETKVCIIAAGIEDAYNTFNTDPQMSSRFKPIELPLWSADVEFGSLLANLELRTPLRKASRLTDPALMLAIHTRSEGILGDICDLIKELAVDAIRSKSEQIKLERVDSFDWQAPSKRKQQKRIGLR